MTPSPGVGRRSPGLGDGSFGGSDRLPVGSVNRFVLVPGCSVPMTIITAIIVRHYAGGLS